MMDMRHLPRITEKMAIVAIGVGLPLLAVGFFIAMVLFRDTDWKRCERAIPYALVTEVQSFDRAILGVDKAIMCKSVEVGAATETIHWLDKNGAKLDR